MTRQITRTYHSVLILSAPSNAAKPSTLAVWKRRRVSGVDRLLIDREEH